MGYAYKGNRFNSFVSLLARLFWMTSECRKLEGDSSLFNMVRLERGMLEASGLKMTNFRSSIVVS